MPQTTITRDFFTVSQLAARWRVAERTVQHYIATRELSAEPLEPEKPRSQWIVALSVVQAFEKEHGLPARS
jgi:hypothetical protein